MEITHCDWCNSTNKVKSFQAVVQTSWLGKIVLPMGDCTGEFDLCAECRRELKTAIKEAKARRENAVEEAMKE